jgi:hypothetical protein
LTAKDAFDVSFILFSSAIAFRCADDSEATAWAKQLIDGHDMELWSGERFIIRLDCKKSSPG